MGVLYCDLGFRSRACGLFLGETKLKFGKREVRRCFLEVGVKYGKILLSTTVYIRWWTKQTIANNDVMPKSGFSLVFVEGSFECVKGLRVF